MEVKAWLGDLGLGRYAGAFAENNIDADVLATLTSEDLKELGVASLGHRKKLLAAIAARSETPGEQAETPRAGGAVAPAPREPERRQLTVMFCDLVGSTALSERLGPEDFREILQAYRETCHAVISRFEGHIARYIGDGLLIYFGYPQAHEDDAARAVHAALGIVAEIEGLGRRLDGISLKVRVAVHTGLVVAGNIGSGETREREGIVGETPNIAARLEGLAAPNTVMISEATRRLVEGLFLCDDLEPQKLKGVSRPIMACQVRQESGAHSRFEAATTAGLTPLVGRESEIGLLLNRWDLAQDSDGQVVLLFGEAGVGKSRILRGFRDRLGIDAGNRILYYGSSYHRNSALYPVVDQLERGLGFQKEDDPPQRLDKLNTVLADLGLSVDEHAPVLALLLSLAANDHYPPVHLSPEEFKNRTFGAMLAIEEAMAARAPLLIVVEDLHWIDPSTLEFLDLMVERLRHSQILFVGTARPEFENPWGDRAHVTTLALNRLSRRESVMLVSKVTHGKSLPDEILNQIIVKTDGVPLFIEELTKTVMESDLLEAAGDNFELSGPLPPLAIPASLQDSLMARLDRLQPVKEVAQLAAALGRSFRRDVLAAVSRLDDVELDLALAGLAAAGLIYRRDLPPDPIYKFKHALVQDAAYQSLLKSTRQDYHRRIASVLEGQFQQTVESEPELLAHHTFEGQLWDKAVHYFRQAGARAVERLALTEARAFFEQALGIIESLPESKATLENAFDIRLELRPVLRQLGEGRLMLEHLREAEDISEKLKDDLRRCRVCAFITTVLSTLDELDEALQIGTRALKIARRVNDGRGDLKLRILSTSILEQTYHYRGEHERVVEFATDNLAALPADWAHEYFGMAMPASVFSRAWLIMSLAELGRFAEAAKYEAEAIQLVAPTGHPHTIGWANLPASTLHLFKGDWAKARALVEDWINIPATLDFAVLLPWAVANSAWALAQIGEADEEAWDRVREGEQLLERQAARGIFGHRGWAYHAVSRACLLLGRLDDAQRLADRSVESSQHQPGFRAHALHLLGDITIHSNRFDERRGEAYYRQALSLAEAHGMRPLAAHCYSGLGKLYRRIDKSEAARENLARATMMYREMDMDVWLEREH